MNYDFEHPPLPSAVPTGNDSTAIAVSAVVVTVLVAWLLFRAKGNERTTVLLCMIGGGLSVVFDAQFSVLMLRWFPTSGSNILYMSSGRAVPAFWVLFQSAFVGGCVAWLITRHGRSPAATWSALWLLASIRLVVEIAGVNQGLWLYYGWQPFRVLGVPLWMPILSATAVLAAARFVAFSLTTHHRMTLLIGVPLSYSIVIAMLSWPVGLALNHRDSNIVLASAAMVGSILLCGIMVETLRRLPASRVSV